MSIQRVAGGLRPSLEIAWLRDDGQPEPLTTATMTGTIEDRAGDRRPIAGTLTVLDGAAGTFEWAFAAGDLEMPGTYKVEFTASFNTAPSPAKSFDVELTVV
jgi:hypothetical protein